MPAVFVHGVPDTYRLWNPLRSHLARTDVVAVSLPGFDAPVPDGFDATKEAYADWLAAELEAVGEPVDLVGHDWGALLVQRVASTRPDLVRTWACGDGPADDTYVWHDMAKMWQTPDVGEQVMESMTAEALPAALSGSGVPEAAAAEVAEHVDETMKRCILALYRSAVTVGAEWQPAVEALGTSRPALVLWGKDDPFVTSEFAERLAARVGARLVLWEGCGHWWPWERPAEAAAELEAFWAAS